MKCEKLNITGITPKTCIARQKIIIRLKETAHFKGSGKNWGWSGATKYLNLLACIRCKKGLAFYNKELQK